MSTIFSYYISRHFLISFLTVFGIFLGLIFLFDVIELLRRASGHDDIGLPTVLQMGFLKLPFLGQQAFPFAVLFGSMVAFWRLTLNSELIVARAAGVSAWQILIPVLGVSLILGLLQIGALNPLASAFLAKFDRLNASYFKGQSNLLAVSSTGLWLRQANAENQSVIHATRLNRLNDAIRLKDVTIFVYEGADQYRQRISAETAELEDGFWHMKNVWIHEREKELPEQRSEFWLETDITLNNINDTFAAPETLSFWDLPSFIENLEKAGFSALRHRLYWHSLLAAPLLLCAMVLIAATFTLKQSQRSSTSYLVVGGIMSGFLLFFFSDVVSALGLRESIPVVLAAWTPSGVSALLGLAMVFHLEDG
ncbi:MAG: LPS export ABC transporter permease LptG [Rhodospirillaceae bacterium TMED167]|nr:LPS export ABC transporter permease LptG [Rhodospirillaceae bacterium]OUW27552.1 MAG: LPS export ABC transporter permease LptG [Rhodospirillaceae bacterium TMED167]